MFFLPHDIFCFVFLAKELLFFSVRKNFQVARIKILAARKELFCHHTMKIFLGIRNQLYGSGFVFLIAFGFEDNTQLCRSAA